ncbi:MAG: PP2C family protein-serine/threonine phosphatase [Microcoleaceae cyanobacterium]
MTLILSYRNAAHNPPLFWQASTQTVQHLDTKDGMLVGLDVDTRYSEAQVELASGDTVLYYTDGVTDASDQRGDRFDEERLQIAFRWACQNQSGSQAILDYIFGEVETFVGPGSHNTDDMTLVVLQVRPTPSSEENQDNA